MSTEVSCLPSPGLREPLSGAAFFLGDIRRDFGPLPGGLRDAFAPGDPRFERPFISAPRPPLLAALRLTFVVGIFVGIETAEAVRR